MILTLFNEKELIIPLVQSLHFLISGWAESIKERTVVDWLQPPFLSPCNTQAVFLSWSMSFFILFSLPVLLRRGSKRAVEWVSGAGWKSGILPRSAHHTEHNLKLKKPNGTTTGYTSAWIKLVLECISAQILHVWQEWVILFSMVICTALSFSI